MWVVSLTDCTVRSGPTKSWATMNIARIKAKLNAKLRFMPPEAIMMNEGRKEERKENAAKDKCQTSMAGGCSMSM